MNIRPLNKTWTAAAGFLLAAVLPLSAADKVDEALVRGAQFLTTQQDDKTGSISLKGRNETAMTSLTILALAALGHQPADPTPEGKTMRKGLAFILRPELQQKDGYFGQADNSRMYGHGIATLMLSEMLGMGADTAQDELIREKCRKGIQLIQNSQKVTKNEHSRGGWRYTPDDASSDLSATVWQVMALRAAKNAGLDVSNSAIEEAIKYIKRLYEDDPDKSANPPRGGFGYQNKGHEVSTTAEGLLALQVCGQYSAPEARGAVERLFKEGVRPEERWFYYTTYYYAQGMYQSGGKFAEQGRKVVSDILLPIQARNGSWETGGGDGREQGPIYATSMAILSLAVKNHYLPIYQR
ncbi:MAG: hypothetical protein JWO81_3495 [Alphaproteobacteria bacterium]|nr:hypothetical protein [Alphaproteobacteria bacterium]